MSLSKQLKKQAGRVAGKASPTMKSSSSEAQQSDKSSRHQQSPRSKETLPDSGFFDGSDGELYGDAGDNNLSYHYSDRRDWVLFGDDAVLNQDEDCYFNPEDAVDIASTKANHGSLYNGKNNEDNTLVTNGHKSSYPANHATYENPQSVAPSHYYTYHPMTKPGNSPLGTWSGTTEQHELIAYCFEQPPNPTHVFEDLQSWHEDIDLDVYAVLF